jgi:hypothetical protein
MNRQDATCGGIIIIIVIVAGLGIYGLFQIEDGLYNFKIHISSTDNENVWFGHSPDFGVNWEPLPFTTRDNGYRKTHEQEIWFRERYMAENHTWTYKEHGPFFMDYGETLQSWELDKAIVHIRYTIVGT